MRELPLMRGRFLAKRRKIYMAGLVRALRISVRDHFGKGPVFLNSRFAFLRASTCSWRKQVSPESKSSLESQVCHQKASCRHSKIINKNHFRTTTNNAPLSYHASTCSWRKQVLPESKSSLESQVCHQKASCRHSKIINKNHFRTTTNNAPLSYHDSKSDPKW